MSATRNVAVPVGSLRKGAYSRLTDNALMALAPSRVRAGIVEIGALPLYNQDLEDDADRPPAWAEFRTQVKAADAVLFITPEYNRSVPAGLKNAIDVGSRPYGHSVWDRKPGTVLSISPGGIGGFGANHHLRQSLVFLNVLPMQQPEAYIGGIADVFEADGSVVNEATQNFFRDFMAAVDAWIETILG